MPTADPAPEWLFSDERAATIDGTTAAVPAPVPEVALDVEPGVAAFVPDLADLDVVPDDVAPDLPDELRAADTATPPPAAGGGIPFAGCVDVAVVCAALVRAVVLGEPPPVAGRTLAGLKPGGLPAPNSHACTWPGAVGSLTAPFGLNDQELLPLLASQ
jgi:hypothetical protein